MWCCNKNQSIYSHDAHSNDIYSMHVTSHGHCNRHHIFLIIIKGILNAGQLF